MGLTQVERLSSAELQAGLGSLTELGPLTQVLTAPPVAVDATGAPLPFAWRPVPGLTGARVDAARLTVLPVTDGDGRDVGVVAAGGEADHVPVTLPAGDTLLRGLRIPGLVRLDGDAEHPVDGDHDLAGHRLVVRSVTGGRAGAPVVAVEPLPGPGMLPEQLTGGGLVGSLLTLPDLPGRRFEVSVCEGDTVADLRPARIRFGDVRALVAPQPSSIAVQDPAGATVAAHAGPGVALLDLDLTAPLQRHLDAAVTDPGTSRADGRIVADGPGSVRLRWSPRVVLLRAVEGRRSISLSGEPALLDLGVAPADREPVRTRMDLTVVHDGLSLHPLSDPVPVAPAGLSGHVVAATAVTRTLPPAALQGLRIGRVAVVGRVMEAADLTLTLEYGGAQPVVATLAGLEAARAPGNEVRWFGLDEPVLVSGPVRVSLAATRGRFGWVSTQGSDPVPVTRWAVVTAPQGHRVAVAGLTVTLTGPETVLPGATLGGPSPYPVATDQLCTVVASSVVQEFAP